MAESLTYHGIRFPPGSRVDLLPLLDAHQAGLPHEAYMARYVVDEAGKPLYGPLMVYTREGWVCSEQRKAEAIGGFVPERIPTPW